MPAPIVHGRAQLQRYLAGVAFLIVITLLVALSVGIYTKAFTDVVHVALKTDRIGNQLSVHGDVKLRGIVVGEVRSVRSNGDGATIELALDPDLAGQVPLDVSARLLPKTLFGEKEVTLILPEGAPGRAVRDGDVISQDRSSTAIETERVLTDVLPVLQSLRPVQLSLTLNALSSSLRGRGDRLGANLALNADYFRELNPSLPDLMEDFRGLADLGDNYAKAAPDVLRLLDNFSAVARNTVDQRTELATFLRTTTTMAASADDFLRINERSLIRLAADSLPSLELYRRYAPEFPCILHTLPGQELLGQKTFGGGVPGLHITLEVIRDQGAYEPQDQPVFGDDRGPNCYGLTGPPIVPFPSYYEPKDGYCDREEAASPGVTTGNCHDGSAALGGAAQRALVGSAVAPLLGLEPARAPDLVMMLFGPLARGATVGYSRD
ncbi:MAG: MCE family protein [Mycobacteriales bacterium]